MTARNSDGLESLEFGDVQILCAAPRGGRARLLYAGTTGHPLDSRELEALGRRAHAPGGPQTPIAYTMLNAIGTGHGAPSGLLAHRDGRDFASDPRVLRVERRDNDDEIALMIECADETKAIGVTHQIALDRASALARFSSKITNLGGERLALDWLAAVCLPVDPALTTMKSFTGRWAGEFKVERIERHAGSFLRENGKGRTSHDSFPGLYLGTAQTGENEGAAMAVHLAWSGNHRLRLDRHDDGAASLQAGELLLPGEIALLAGESYQTPDLYVGWSSRGYGEVTRRLHRLVANRIAPRAFASARKVHFNSWEAVYFDHSSEKLLALAERAAEVGAERFVLDDGWFGARRSDRKGLGDWFVSPDVYPQGLVPLAQRVRELGMDFGLWFEPEMINPDSALFRAHPDWVLGDNDLEAIESRHQFALDLTRQDVRDYLFERIDALVRELGLAYIKWDMNRDIEHPVGRDGRAAMHRQTRALYRLIERIRAAHRDLEIESCSSGGARADYAILKRADRVWPSDNNDACARLPIMRGAAHFLPLAVLGNHVGAARSHITGRRLSMAYRAGCAIFGHMGLELDLTQESARDLETLRAAIALYKTHRALIHKGLYHRLETPEHMIACGCVDRARREALFQIATLDEHPFTQPPFVRLAGLEPQARYRLRVLWPSAQAQELGEFSGEALMRYGLAPPRGPAHSCFLYSAEALD